MGSLDGMPSVGTRRANGHRACCWLAREGLWTIEVWLGFSLSEFGQRGEGGEARAVRAVGAGFGGGKLAQVVLRCDRWLGWIFIRRE